MRDPSTCEHERVPPGCSQNYVFLVLRKDNVLEVVLVLTIHDNHALHGSSNTPVDHQNR